MSTTLTHHGIFGMKWGVRRFQNKDGSLTSAGKARYSKKDVYDDFEKSANEHRDAMDRIMENGPRISEEADRLGEEYEKAFNEFKIDEESKKQAIANIKKEYGNNPDRDTLEFAIYDELDDKMIDMVREKVSSKRNDFDDLQNQYWEDVKAVTSTIREKYGDVEEIQDGPYTRTGQEVVSKIFQENLDTLYNSYITRHFDDYWVLDTDARYEAQHRMIEEVAEEFKKN